MTTEVTKKVENYSIHTLKPSRIVIQVFEAIVPPKSYEKEFKNYMPDLRYKKYHWINSNPKSRRTVCGWTVTTWWKRVLELDSKRLNETEDYTECEACARILDGGSD